MRLRRPLIGALFAALTFFASLSAIRAQEADADARARRHFEGGTAYFEVGDYESALREFEVAYGISHRPGLLYNIYTAYERLGRFGEAATMLERYLAEEPEIDNRAALEERLARVRERATTASVPGAATSEPATTEAPVIAPPPIAPTPPPASAPPLLTISGFTLAGVGVVMFAVGGGLVLSEDARLRGCSPGCAASDVGTLDSATIVADVGLGTAVLGTILGVIGLVVENGGPSREGSAGVTLRGRSLLVTF